MPWSGAPDSVRCTRGLHAELLTFGKIQRRFAIIHWTVRCSKGGRLRNSPASGNRNGCSAIIHRTCPVFTGLSGVTTRQWLLHAPTATCSALNARQTAQKSGTCEAAHRTLYSACPVCHRTSRWAQQSELQRSEPNDLVTWLAHRTVRCTMRQTASTKWLVWWLGL